MKAHVKASLEAKGLLSPTAKAQKAAEIRWERYDQLKERLAFDWDNMPLSEALKTLEAMLSEHHKGARIYERRLGEQSSNSPKCEYCEHQPKADYKWPVAPIVVKNKGAETYRNAYFCTSACLIEWNKAGRIPRQ